MPPKAKCSAAPSKKTEQKKKEKVIEDRTFGLKNKKGAKMQKYIQQVQHQVKQGNNPRKASDDPKKTDKEKKELKRKEEEELKSIFKPVASQKLDRGVDPKSVLCAFFKQGLCSKGDKCKFSHDLTVERKSEKRSLYVDVRDDGEGEGLEEWDEKKLNEMAASRHGEQDKNKPKTANVCKHFLEAVENRKFGWFWICPNGEKCIYRHALPPGYILKRDKKKEEKQDEVSLEELIEKERAGLGLQLTKVTLQTFLAWKRRKLQEKVDAAKKEEDKKRADFKAGRNVGLSGREMFTFNPDLVAGDDCDEGDEAFDTTNLPTEEEVEDNSYQYIELKLDLLEASEADGSGTQALEDRMERLAAEDEEKEKAAAGGATTNGLEAEDACGPIDENLFAGDDLDDLDDLYEQVAGLELEESE